MHKGLFSGLAIVIFSVGCYAQKGTHSPYSILGIGELNWSQYAIYSGMGNVQMANTDSAAVNNMNPAMYAYLLRHKPVFQVGLNGKFSRFETSSAVLDKSNAGMSQFQLGLPIGKRWGMAMGLMPYSSRGYSIYNLVVSGDDTTHQYVNEGSGGISQVFFGLSCLALDIDYPDTNFKKKRGLIADGKAIQRIDTIVWQRGHKFSFGVNGNFLFGSATSKRTYEYIIDDDLNLNSRVENGLRISDGFFDLGVNYQNFFKSDSMAGSFSIGVSYSPQSKLRAFQDLFAYNYEGSFYSPNKIVYVKDTVQYVVDDQGIVLLPEVWRGGLEYRFGPNRNSGAILKIGLDVRFQRWTDYYSQFGTSISPTTLKDRLSLGAGFEIVPATIYGTRSNSTPYINKIRYRLGFNYTQTEWQPTNDLDIATPIDDYGMSFGLGFPVESDNSSTTINFGASFGNLGTTENGLIRERYLGIYFGLSLTPGRRNLWFIKPRYN
jgi:hypothetical protein